MLKKIFCQLGQYKNKRFYSLRCGIVGLPNVGKSTLFNALGTGKIAKASNFPFCTIDPNRGMVSVLDPRLEILNELVKPKKKTPTSMEFVDIAGLVKNASKGAGLGNKFLANIRETNAIAHVVRCFDSEKITHVENSVNPVRDAEIIETELILKDIETIEKAISKISRLAKTQEVFKVRLDILNDLTKFLNEGNIAKNYKVKNQSLVKELSDLFKEMNLLSAKPMIYIANVVNPLELTNSHVEKLKEYAISKNCDVIPICAEMEAEIAQMEDEEEKKEFMNQMGIKEESLSKLIKSCYDQLKILTFFTQGEQEVRAWTAPKGCTAPQAGAVIHTDFESKFIKAEVIDFEDFEKLKSEKAARKANKLRTEGKEYIVKDGDIMVFKIKN